MTHNVRGRMGPNLQKSENWRQDDRLTVLSCSLYLFLYVYYMLFSFFLNTLSSLINDIYIHRALNIYNFFFCLNLVTSFLICISTSTITTTPAHAVLHFVLYFLDTIQALDVHQKNIDPLNI